MSREIETCSFSKVGNPAKPCPDAKMSEHAVLLDKCRRIPDPGDGGVLEMQQRWSRA